MAKSTSKKNQKNEPGEITGEQLLKKDFTKALKTTKKRNAPGEIIGDKKTGIVPAQKY